MSFRFPKDVGGWLSEPEGEGLYKWAAFRRVLEIGSFKGKSTICLAQSAKAVTTVDPFDGRATPEPGSTLAECKANLERYGVASNVDVRVGTMEDVGASLGQGFDLVFIDGDHSYEAVRNDTEWALRLLGPEGIIAYHDYRWGGKLQGGDPGVEAAVNDLLADGGKVLFRCESLVIVRPPAVLLTGIVTEPRLVLGMPCAGEVRKSGAAVALLRNATNRNIWRTEYIMESSVLTLGFNRLWAEALNAKHEHGATHFVMLHDDICPQMHFADILLDEIMRTNADVVSCVVPLKSPEALTSTAFGWAREKSLFRPLRRLTMREVMELPETFGRDDVKHLAGPPHLFINTGCFIADLRKPWVEKNVFRNIDRLVRLQNGKYKADCVSEDWAFSIDLERWGARVLATRKVKLFHSNRAFNNHTAWGLWNRDEEYFARIENQELSNGEQRTNAGASGHSDRANAGGIDSGGLQPERPGDNPGHARSGQNGAYAAVG